MTDHQRSTAELVGDLSAQVTSLVRAELRLAAAELKDKGARAGVGAGLTGTAAAVALLGAGTLVASAVLGLATVLSPWFAALLVAIGLLVVAGLLAAVGTARLRSATPPIPEEAIDSTKQDIETVKASVRR
jgi:membrane protein